MNNLKLKISENFSRAAENYGSNATLQKQVAENLVQKTAPYLSAKQKFLDIGSGTGFVAQALNRPVIQLDIALEMCRASSQISPAICADMECLPFLDSSFNIVFSSSSVQWADMKLCFAEVNRVLAEGGYFIFSTFGEQTLSDIKASFKIANIEPKLNPLPANEEIKRMVEIAGFSVVSSHEETCEESFNSLADMFRSITDIGAATSAVNENSITKDKLILVEDIYRRNFSAESIKASWQIQYYICKK